MLHCHLACFALFCFVEGRMSLLKCCICSKRVPRRSHLKRWNTKSQVVFQASIFRCYCWCFRNPANSPVEVGSWPPIFYRVFWHPKWLFGISEPSTVSWLRGVVTHQVCRVVMPYRWENLGKLNVALPWVWYAMQNTFKCLQTSSEWIETGWLMSLRDLWVVVSSVFVFFFSEFASSGRFLCWQIFFI